jgi:hypothetical protein
MTKPPFPTERRFIKPMNFDGIPHELMCRTYWACWRTKKIARQAKAGLPEALVNKYEHWATFEVAKSAYERFDAWGVGTLLTGDGLAVVDIDKCIHDGVIDPRATEVLARLNVRYVEYSPSGSGLHGWGLLDGSYSTRPVIAGLEVEFYTQKRFMTVTGQVLWDDGIHPINDEELQPYRKPDASEEKEELEDMESHSSLSSASSLAHVMIQGMRYQLPASCVPTGYGQRNAAIFEYARFVKGKHPNADKTMRKEYVGSWFADHESRIATKDIGDSLVDFEHAWSRVKYPYGEEWSKAKSLMDGFTAPPEVAGYGHRMCTVYQLCRALESLSPSGVFFVALKPAGEVLGCDEATVSRYLLRLIDDEVIDIDESHVPNRKARRFKFLNPAYSASWERDRDYLRHTSESGRIS